MLEMIGLYSVFILEGKNMKISIIAAGAAAAMFALTFTARAGDTATANPFLPVLSAVTQAELPAKAADLVAQAGTKKQQQTTIDVVKTAVGLNPAAAPVIVGSISETTPTMAATAAGTAVGLAPNEAVAIARAAAAAAPQQAGKIVEAICRVVPANYSEVAEAVADVAPGESKEILEGVAAAIPTLKGPINQILLTDNGSVPSVYSVMELISSDSYASSSGPSGGVPAVVNPIINPFPSPASPIDLNPGSGGQVPPGGQNYSSP
jgi:hypothetical protein